MKYYDTIIIGAGFNGIYSAWRLAKSGRKVALLESSHQIGGILNSLNWKDYWIDNGTHNLDMRDLYSEYFFKEILEDDLVILDEHTWASTTKDSWSYGIESPDFSRDEIEFSEKVIHEMDLITTQDLYLEKSETLSEFLRRNYGPLLSTRMEKILLHKFSINAKLAGSEVFKFMKYLQRVKLGSDREMAYIKNSSKFWNDRLSVTNFCSDVRFLGSNIKFKFGYPRLKGMKGFCEAAEIKLKKLGVDIFFNTKVSKILQSTGSIKVHSSHHILSGQNLFWSLSLLQLAEILRIQNTLKKHYKTMGTTCVAFEVDSNCIEGPDYLVDYHEQRRPFRYNKQGIYSKQITDSGNTFILTETYKQTALNYREHQKAFSQDIWKDLSQTQFIKKGTILQDFFYWHIPVSSIVPSKGWSHGHKKLLRKLQPFASQIYWTDPNQIGRLNFIKHYENKLHHKLVK